MKEIKKEVKTFITIELGVTDLSKLVATAKSTSTYTGKLFKECGNTVSDLNEVLEKLWIRGTGTEFDFIARYYGYYGWEHAGLYCKMTNKHTMTMYNYGDTMEI